MNTQADRYNQDSTYSKIYAHRTSDAYQASHSYTPESIIDSLEEYDDQELIALYQRGSMLALTEILNRYEPLLINYANRNHTLPIGREEILHHLTVIMIEALQTYDQDSGIPLAGYLKSKIKYGHWNLFQKARKVWQHEVIPDTSSSHSPASEPSLLDGDQEISHTDGSLHPLTPSVEEMVLGNYYHQALYHKLRLALHALNQQDKALIHDIYLEDLSMAEVARRAHCTRQNINYRHHKILNHLRQMLMQEYLQ